MYANMHVHALANLSTYWCSRNKSAGVAIQRSRRQSQWGGTIGYYALPVERKGRGGGQYNGEQWHREQQKRQKVVGKGGEREGAGHSKAQAVGGFLSGFLWGSGVFGPTGQRYRGDGRSGTQALGADSWCSQQQDG